MTSIHVSGSNAVVEQVAHVPKFMGSNPGVTKTVILTQTMKLKCNKHKKF
jgi:hypothetical protein